MTELLKYPDPRLQLVCDPVDFEAEAVYRADGPVNWIEYPRIDALLDEMWEKLEELIGYGLAAPQLGSPVRVLIIHVPGGCKIELINPEIVRAWGGKFMSDEGCLSYPGKRVRVMRHRQIKVKGFDRFGKPVAFGGKNVQAAAFQHEIDHLNGINLADYEQEKQSA